MMASMMNARNGWVIAALGVALTACGGGGGDSGGTGGTSGGSAGGGSAVTGLVPAAPAIGAILYADALTLRPAQAGARWEYRGSSSAYTGATPVAYLTATSQTTVSAAGVSETTTNSGNTGPGTQAVSLAGGVVSTPQSVDFAGKGTPQDFSVIELRSAVRAGDQYTILDRRYTDTAIDADGDGKPDALDVAIYARVVGTEALTLPNLPALSAVRVDTFVLSRVVFSSTGQPSPTEQALLQTWYAPGIGIVRQASTQPTASGNSIVTTDELLTSWDGVTTGLGAMAPVAGVVPAGNAVFAGQPVRTDVRGVVAASFGDHALVFSDAPDGSLNLTASRIDMRGQVLSSTLLTGLSGTLGFAGASANDVIFLEPLVSGAVKDFGLTRIDSQGALVGAVRGVTVHLGGSHVSSYVIDTATAVDASTLWVLWSRWYYDPGNGNVPGTELVLQAFGFDGLPLRPEVVLDPAVSGSNLKVAASGGQALMTWTSPAPGNDVMFAAASVGEAVTVHALATDLPASSLFVTPLRLGANSALMWSSVPGNGLPMDAVAGVLLDANFALVRAGATLLDEQIPGLSSYSWPGPVAAGSRIVVTSTRSALLFPGDTTSQMVGFVDWLDTGNAALAHTPVKTVRLPAVDAQALAVFPDRVLIFGGTYTLATTVVWLR